MSPADGKSADLRLGEALVSIVNAAGKQAETWRGIASRLKDIGAQRSASGAQAIAYLDGMADGYDAAADDLARRADAALGSGS